MHKSGQQTINAEGFKVSSVLKGFIWSLVSTLILGILFSLLLQFTSLSEGMLDSYAIFIFFISMLIGSTIGARSAGSKGLWHGLSITLLYFVLTLFIGLIWSIESLSLIFLAKRIAAAIVAGILGGIIGIGLSK